MARKAAVPGCIYLNNGRYWWKVKLPGENRSKPRPLKPAGARYATKDPGVAETIAQEIWQREAFKAKLPINDGSITALINAYLNHARNYYRQSNEAAHIEYALAPLIEDYPTVIAEDFRPRMLKGVRRKMIAAKLKRCTINRRIGVIKRMFNWAVEEELIPASTAFALQIVKNLEAGRSDAEESVPVESIDEKHVLAVLPYATPTVADMMQVQLLTGMRSTEMCMMRPKDIDRTGEIWLYTPTDPKTNQQKHKTRHKSVDKKIALGPKAQEILIPYLQRRQPEEYIFSPADSMQEMRERRRQNRKTPLNYGNSIGTNRKIKPAVIPRSQFTKDSYGLAVRRAIINARDAGVNVPDFHPHRLRHTAGTKVRQGWGDGNQGIETGLQAACALLGHKDIKTTQLYAELNKALAIEAARRFG